MAVGTKTRSTCRKKLRSDSEHKRYLLAHCRCSNLWVANGLYFTSRTFLFHEDFHFFYFILSLPFFLFLSILLSYLASSQAWCALSIAIWSLWRVPENFLCTQPSLLRSDGVSKGSGKLVLAAIVQVASPHLEGGKVTCFKRHIYMALFSGSCTWITSCKSSLQLAVQMVSARLSEVRDPVPNHVFWLFSILCSFKYPDGKRG